MSPQQSLDYSRLASTLYHHYLELCNLEGNIWTLAVEHMMFVIEQDLKKLSSLTLSYRAFLAESGLSKNSYSLADGM